MTEPSHFTLRQLAAELTKGNADTEFTFATPGQRLTLEFSIRGVKYNAWIMRQKESEAD